MISHIINESAPVMLIQLGLVYHRPTRAYRKGVTDPPTVTV
jgi:hypothetical protein